MAPKFPWIKEGRFDFAYFDVLNKSEINSYYEIDLGEINLINTRTDIFKKIHTANNENGGYLNLQTLSWNIFSEYEMAVPVLPVLQKLKIGEYNDVEQVIKDFNSLFSKLLEYGYYMNGAHIVDLHTSFILSEDHHYFEFFFASKMHLIAQRLQRIDPFLNFQLQKFIANGRTAIDFKRFVRLCVREFEDEFKFSEKLIRTVEEWIENLSHSDPKTKSDNNKGQNQKAEGWTKAIAILMRAILNEKLDTFVIAKQANTCEAFKILSGYSKKSLENHLSATDPHSNSQIQFSNEDFLKIRKYLKRIIHQVDLVESSIKA